MLLASWWGPVNEERIKNLSFTAIASKPALGARSTRNLKDSESASRLLSGQDQESGCAGPAPDGLKPLLVSPSQARKLLGVSLGTLYNFMNQGLLESFRVGGSRRITVASIERFVAERVAKGRCPAATGR